MPRLRLLADNATAAATEASGVDSAGNYIFDVGVGDNVLVRIDATGFAAGDAITSSDWDAPDGAIIDGEASSGLVVSTLASVPNDGLGTGAVFTVRNTLTLDSGLVRNTTVLLRAMGR